MQIDENTRGSLAHQEAVRVLKGWMLALFVVDYVVCIIGGMSRGLSETHVLWLTVKSLFFSYSVGIVLLVVVVRFFGRAIGVRKVYPVGFLRYCVLLGCLSVIMGLILVLSEARVRPPEDSSDLLNPETEKWQPVKDAKVFCAKEGKQVLLQKLDRANFSVQFICI